MTQPLSACRLCGFGGFTLMMDLGRMSSCGVFPATALDDPPPEPIQLGKCLRCGLAQLLHEFDPADTFREGFGYRSAGNPEMVEHLSTLAAQVTQLADLRAEDIVIDIGCNDGTFLSWVPAGVVKVGVDPVAPDISATELITHRAFWDDRFWDDAGSAYAGKVAAVTCFACLYDVPDLQGFMRLVAQALRPGGWFVFEVAYLPAMIQNTGFDIISHEHLSYFRLRDLTKLFNSAGLWAEGCRETATQGGSILVWGRKRAPGATGLFFPEADEVPAKAWEDFRWRCTDISLRVVSYLTEMREAKKVVHGLCASTKGNTLLQAFGIGPSLLPCIAEKDPSKWGRLAPGTLIPIVSEKQSREERPDAYLCLSHQFRRSLIERERAHLDRGGVIVFPLPKFEVVHA